MILEITSKSNNEYIVEWMASIDDFINWIETTESNFIRALDYPGRKSLLKINEIEAISIVKDSE